MTIGITGGTGFIGRHLTALLVSKGYEVVVFTRSRKKPLIKVSYAHWNPGKGSCDIAALGKIDAMVNLAGAGIADKTWTAKRKQEITESRVNATAFLVSQLKAHAPNCKTFISASAIGFYGPDKAWNIPFTEDAQPANDFLGDTCRLWEETAQEATAFARTVILRFGIVLGKESGALPKFLQPISFGIKPIPGNGAQMVSWIAVRDLARLIFFAIDQEQVSGIYNAVSPNPVSMHRLMEVIALVKGGTKIPVHIPSVLLKMVLGEMSGEILKSCTASAEKTLSTGFTFNYPGIDEAVKAILARNK